MSIVHMFGRRMEDLSFLDVETTGLTLKNIVTSVALLNCDRIDFFIEGINLKQLGTVISDCKTLVTFNGSRFDFKFLQLKYRLSIPSHHLDLLKYCRKINLYGGLKSIERSLNIVREEKCSSGKEAVFYWRKYTDKQDYTALRELLIYNGNDVLSLAQLYLFLSGREYKRLISSKGFVDLFFERYFGRI